ncbi:GntR family transcriptional regulator [Streptomyces sp. CAI 127]|uniref:GntR family transcriptional regulator n=1 Tax=Streptomyces sp. CAI 127 TaxID=1076397 RepID=UPI001587BA21|nr:GntR family transcriptional regulator [Streptomyces sp. CAI 127]NUW03834.1 GntR family transcriptional regulator [Streptomyces sp. CAI 127]
MATDATGREPKYQRIAKALKAEIQSGALEPGARLPGENDLMSQYGVARMTARQALGVLQSEGLTEARKGVGVFVRAFQPLRRQGIPRLMREQWGSGRSVWDADLGDRDLAVDQVEVRDGAASENAARVLGLGAGERVWIRSRRFVLDGKPVLLSTSYLPASLVEGSAITQSDTGPGGIYARLAELGYGPVHFREEIRSRMPLPEEVAKLRLPAGTPVMLICRTAFTEEGRVVEVNEMVLDAAAYVLEYAFDA